MRMALAMAALLGAGFVCPPCGGPDHHPCPPIGKQAGEPCGGPCGHLGQCGDGLKCYPRKLKTIRGAVALLGRFGAFLGPAPPGVCKCATLCDEQVEATSDSNGTANVNATATRAGNLTVEATRASNLTVEAETFPVLDFEL